MLKSIARKNVSMNKWLEDPVTGTKLIIKTSWWSLALYYIMEGNFLPQFSSFYSGSMPHQSTTPSLQMGQSFHVTVQSQAQDAILFFIFQMILCCFVLIHSENFTAELPEAYFSHLWETPLPVTLISGQVHSMYLVKAWCTLHRMYHHLQVHICDYFIMASPTK